jgi:signal transduction histidine kinase
VDEVQPAIERFQHTLRIESPADPVVLYADPTRVAQMIANHAHLPCDATAI